MLTEISVYVKHLSRSPFVGELFSMWIALSRHSLRCTVFGQRLGWPNNHIATTTLARRFWLPPAPCTPCTECLHLSYGVRFQGGSAIVEESAEMVTKMGFDLRAIYWRIAGLEWYFTWNDQANIANPFHFMHPKRDTPRMKNPFETFLKSSSPYIGLGLFHCQNGHSLS